MVITGREVGNQIVYDKFNDSGSSTSAVFGSGMKQDFLDKKAKEHNKQASLEHKIALLSSKEFIAAHEQISDYVSFIKNRPEANKTNYDKQNTLLANIADLVQPIITQTEIVTSDEDFLNQQIQGLTDDTTNTHVSFIANFTQRQPYVAMTNNKIYLLESGKHIYSLPDHAQHLVGGGVIEAMNVKSTLFALQQEGVLYTATVDDDVFSMVRPKQGESVERVEKINTINIHRKKHGPYKSVFSHDQNVYAQNTKGQVVDVRSGKLHNTRELQKIAKENTRVFSFEGQKYTYDANGHVAILASQDNPFSHTQAYKKYLEELDI